MRAFGVVGGVGMVFCWLATFTILPAALAVLHRRGGIKQKRLPTVGTVIARLISLTT